MSVIDTIVEAVTPTETREARRDARVKAKASARQGDWLWSVIEHHEAIEAAFNAVKDAASATTRCRAQQRLAVLLTAHANAEESVLYPGLARAGQPSQATGAYAQQATAKTDMALLETLSPMSPEYLQHLEHIHEAVAHHMYEEESGWFPALKASAQDQGKLAARFQQEFERYAGNDALKADPLAPGPEISINGRVVSDAGTPPHHPIV